MSARDYILCSDCGCKLIYDGDDNNRERLEERYGDPRKDWWTVELLCPECVRKLSNPLPAREDLIQCLLATQGQSEGVTADAILTLLKTEHDK